MRKQILEGLLVINIFEMISMGPNTVVRKLIFSTNQFDRVGHLNPLDEIISYTCNLNLKGDILITCHGQGTLRDEKVFRFSFHTGFVPSENVLRLRKCDLDDACHNKSAYFTENFMLDLMFDIPDVKSENQTITVETETTEQAEREREGSDIVSHKHLYAKTSPNTRNHILLEFNEDLVQDVIKHKLSQPKPLTGMRSQSVPEQAMIQPSILVRAPSAPSTNNVQQPETLVIATASLVTEKVKKPDILVQVIPTNNEDRPIAVRFRIKRQK
jgi:hypothetical protein